MKLYGAIGVFQHQRKDRRFIRRYEERILLVNAASLKSARGKALAEFRRYESSECVFLGKYEVFEARGTETKGVIEIAHTMRLADMTPRRYLSAFWGDRRPRSCDDVGWTHVWHNVDGKRSACYNCSERRRGQLWKKSGKGKTLNSVSQ